MIREFKNKNDKIQIEGTVNEAPVDILIDTGSTQNYISESSIPKNLREKLVDPVRIELANDMKIEAIEKASCLVKLGEDRSTIYKVEALVMPGMKDDFILGVPFLIKNDSEIHFKTGTIRIDDQYKKLKQFGAGDRNLEDCLVEKCNKLMSATAVDFDNMIDYFKRKNPKFGHIKGYQHRIVLEDKTPIQKKAYPVPEKAKSEFKEKLKAWKDNDVIKRSNLFFASRVFGVAKKNMEMRIVTDYTALHKNTRSEPYHFPDVYNACRTSLRTNFLQLLILIQALFESKLRQKIVIKRRSLLNLAILSTNECHLGSKMPLKVFSGLWSKF